MSAAHVCNGCGYTSLSAAGWTLLPPGSEPEWAVSTGGLTFPAETEAEARTFVGSDPERRSLLRRSVGPWTVATEEEKTDV